MVWTRRILRDFQGVGDMLKAGRLSAVQAAGRERGFVWLSGWDAPVHGGDGPQDDGEFLRKAGQEFATHLKSGVRKAGVGQQPERSADTPAVLAEPPPYAHGRFTVSMTGKAIDSTLPTEFRG